MLRRVFGLPGDSTAERVRSTTYLAGHGCTAVAVPVSAVDDELAERIRPAVDAGLAVWGCRAAFSVRGFPDAAAAPLLARDPDGVPRTWFGSGCPNQPALRQNHLDLIAQLARTGDFAGFMLDGIRFASPNASEGFFTCFCAECAAKADALGIDFERMHQAVAALRGELSAVASPLANDPRNLVAKLTERGGVADWLRFRAACIAEHVREVRTSIDAVSRETGRQFQLGAYFFTPSFAPLVGQDYAALAPLLDVVSPMIYRTLEGDATLVAEWGSLARINALPAHGVFWPAEVAAEVAAARALIPTGGPPLVPILQLADDRVGEVTHAVLDAGADGLDYFIFRAGHEAYIAQAAPALSGQQDRLPEREASRP